jgi:hypothetical protein
MALYLRLPHLRANDQVLSLDFVFVGAHAPSLGNQRARHRM